jgi:hypothetical protein
VFVCFEPAAVLDVQVILVLAALPCAHGALARVTSSCGRAYAPMSFSEPVTPFWTLIGTTAVLLALCVALKWYMDPAHNRMNPFGYVYRVATAAVFSASRSAWQLVVAEDDPAFVVLGFVGVVVYVIPPIILVAMWFRAHRNLGRFAPFTWYGDQSAVVRFLSPRGSWGSEAFFAQHGAMVAHLAPQSLAVVALPFVKVMGPALITAVAATEPGDCAALYALCAVWYGCSSFFVVWCSVYRSHLHCCLAAMTDAAIALTAVGGWLQAIAPTNSTPYVFYFGVGLASLMLLCRAVQAVALWWLDKEWRQLSALRGKRSTAMAEVDD